MNKQRAGLLKAYLDNPIDIPTSRANKPDRLGVTLVYNAGQFDPHEVEDIVEALDGKTINVSALDWIKGETTDFILVSLDQDIEELIGKFYPYPFHVTIGWDEGSAPLKAAMESLTSHDVAGAISFDRKATIEFQEFDEISSKPLYKAAVNAIEEVEF